MAEPCDADIVTPDGPEVKHESSYTPRTMPTGAGRFKAVMAQLRAAGTEATRAECAERGVTGPCFGVPPEDLERVAQPLRRDQPLALQLFETGVFDARLLATLVADPAAFTAGTCDRWVKACAERALSRAVAAVVASTVHREKKSDVWRASKGEWKRVCGWMIAEALAEPGVVYQAWLKGRVGEFHRGFKSAPPSVQSAMKAALIAIGGHRPEFRERVLGMAKKFKLRDVTEGVDALQAAWEAGQQP